MKRFNFLIAIITIALASCEKNNQGTDYFDSSADDKLYEYNISMRVTDEPVFNNYTIESFAQLQNLNFPDSAWTMSLNDFFCSSSIDNVGAKIEIDIEGNFSFDITYESSIGGEYMDHVIGSGFFNSDTLYFSYSYEEQESGNTGYVDVWSH